MPALRERRKRIHPLEHQKSVLRARVLLLATFPVAEATQRPASGLQGSPGPAPARAPGMVALQFQSQNVSDRLFWLTDQWHRLPPGVPHLVVYTAFFYFSSMFFCEYPSPLPHYICPLPYTTQLLTSAHTSQRKLLGCFLLCFPHPSALLTRASEAHGKEQVPCHLASYHLLSTPRMLCPVQSCPSL